MANPKSQTANPVREGWQGWDDYAPFYDWENARTLGRRDVPFWRRVASQARGDVLELGCGTGRVSIPLARAQLKAGHAGSRNAEERTLPRFVRGDVRALPFATAHFAMVLAPYGILQSLVRERDLVEALESVAHVLRRSGTFGMDLVPDVPNWREYRNRVQLRGRTRGGRRLTLIESVRQNRRRRLTIFEQRYLERRGDCSTEHRFELTFRTLAVPEMTRRLERAGFAVDAVVGDYRGRPWDARADVWIILAKKV